MNDIQYPFAKFKNGITVYVKDYIKDDGEVFCLLGHEMIKVDREGTLFFRHKSKTDCSCDSKGKCDWHLLYQK